MRTINADGTVKTAHKELAQAKAAADDIVDQTRTQVQELAQKVKDYDTFIQDVEKNQIHLVSSQNASTTISAPLIKGNTTTQEMIAQQEAPMKTYLDLNQGLVAGYQKALDNSSPEGLNMTQDTYNKTKTLLNNL